MYVLLKKSKFFNYFQSFYLPWKSFRKNNAVRREIFNSKREFLDSDLLKNLTVEKKNIGEKHVLSIKKEPIEYNVSQKQVSITLNSEGPMILECQKRNTIIIKKSMLDRKD